MIQCPYLLSEVMSSLKNRFFRKIFFFSLFAVSLTGLKGDPLFKLINDYRAQMGMNSLKQNEFLSEVAQRYAEELVKRGVISHKDERGRRVLDRVQDAGGTCVKAGEVLGFGPDRTSLLKGWIQSPVHKDVLLGSWFQTGIGIARLENTLVAVVIYTQGNLTELKTETREEGVFISWKSLMPAELYSEGRKITGIKKSGESYSVLFRNPPKLLWFKRDSVVTDRVFYQK